MQTRYKIGDKVRFLNETGGGTIARIDGQGFIFVETDEGFEIPAGSNELIPADDFLSDRTDDQISAVSVKSEKKQGGHKENLEDGLTHTVSFPSNVMDNENFNVLLGFTPEMPGPVFSQHIECYLINDSEYYIYYLLGTFEQGNFYYLSSGMLESNTKYLVRTFNHSDLSKISELHLQVIWISGGRYMKKQILDQMINISTINFSKESYYVENVYFDHKAVLFQALKPKRAGKDTEKPVKEVLSTIKQRMTGENKIIIDKKQPVTDALEVDLHIDQIVKDSRKYSASEILSLQLKRLDESIEEAISKKMRRLVIIHGVGQGTLKMQIRKELQEKYPEYLFQDASFKEYGFGATMVHLHTIRKQ